MPVLAFPPDRRSTAQRPPSRHEFAGLDVLRLVACLSVLLYHFGFRGAARDGMTDFSLPALQGASKYGFLGVDLFFVISGFVITYSAGGRTAWQFAVSRIVRLYPAFLVCMPLSFTVLWWFGQPQFLVTAGQFIANLAIVAPAFHQGFVDGVYWSIVCEMIFYGWILLLIAGRLLGTRMPMIVLVWLAASVVNEAALHSPALTWVLLTRYSGFFAIGVMLHHGRFAGWSPVSVLAMGAAGGTAALQLLGDLAYHNTYYVGTHFDGFVAVALCCALIGAVAAIVFLERRERRPPLALLGGGITYPLYLLHQNIGYVALNRLRGSLPDGLLLVLVSSALMVLAWLVWRFLETPMQRRLKTLLLSAQPLRAFSRPQVGSA